MGQHFNIILPYIKLVLSSDHSIQPTNISSYSSSSREKHFIYFLIILRATC